MSECLHFIQSKLNPEFLIRLESVNRGPVGSYHTAVSQGPVAGGRCSPAGRPVLWIRFDHGVPRYDMLLLMS